MSEYTPKQIKALKEASDATTGVVRGLTAAVDQTVAVLSDVAAGVQPPKPPVPPQPVPPPPPPMLVAKILKDQAAALVKAAALLEKTFATKRR